MGARRKFGRCRLPSDRLGTQPQFQLRLSTPRSGQRGGENGSFFSIHPSGWSGACRLPRSVQRPPDPCSGRREAVPIQLQQNLQLHVDVTMESHGHLVFPSMTPLVVSATRPGKHSRLMIPFRVATLFFIFFSHLNEREYLSRMREQRHGQKLFSGRAPTLASSMGTLYMLSGAGTGPKSDHRRQRSQS